MDIDFNDTDLLTKNGDINLGYLANSYVEYFLNNNLRSIKRLVDNPIDLKLSVKNKKIYLFHSNFFELSDKLPNNYYVLKYNNIRVNVIFSKLRNNSFFKETVFSDFKTPFFFKKKFFKNNDLVSLLKYKTLYLVNYLFKCDKSNEDNNNDIIIDKKISLLYEKNNIFNLYINKKAKHNLKKLESISQFKTSYDEDHIQDHALDLIKKRIFKLKEIIVNNLLNRIFKGKNKYIVKYFNFIQDKIWENSDIFPIIKKYALRKNQIITERSLQISKRSCEFKYYFNNYPKLVCYLFNHNSIDHINKKDLNYLNDKSYYLNNILSECSFNLKNNNFQKLMLNKFTLADIKRISNKFCFKYDYSIYNYNQINDILNIILKHANLLLKRTVKDNKHNHNFTRTYILNNLFECLYFFTNCLYQFRKLNSNKKINNYICKYIKSNCYFSDEEINKLHYDIDLIEKNENLLNMNLKNTKINKEYYSELKYFLNEKYSVKLFENFLEVEKIIHNISSKNKGFYKKLFYLKEFDKNRICGVIRHKGRSIGIFEFNIDNKKILLKNILIIDEFEGEKEKIYDFINFFKMSIENNTKM